QANEDGYSRVVDGDTRTFWKSNPYLDRRFTGEPDDRHPQWLLVDLEELHGVDAARIHWGTPFATRYAVQYWAGAQPRDPDDDSDGEWRTFAHGAVTGAHGGTTTLRLADTPVRARWLRVMMYESSHTAERGSVDVRDSLGYAIRELELGTLTSDGSFTDIVRHASSAARQTRVTASSTDPWHRATDRDENVEQPGIDLMFSSGMTRGLPMLLPVGVLYDTPDNAAALLRYVRRRGYPVPRLELGEEPDGQYVSPDDFAALYLQTADQLHAVDPSVRLGGPSFQSNEIDAMMAWKQGATDRPWTARFMDVLRARRRTSDFTFLSFEWYPFDTLCTPTPPQLARAVPRLREALARFRDEGLPAGVPIVITEYGYSAFAGAPEVTRAGAILNTESVAAFLTLGGSQAFLYGTEPSALDRNAECDSWGDNTLFIANGERRVSAPTATYHAARMLTTLWADSAGGVHTLYRALATVPGTRDSARIGAYPVRRPDGRLALLLVNRDSTHAWRVALPAAGSASPMRGPFDLWQLSATEYEWHP
ncbi:MAG TPA: discoidin domain-containing protein, partial [Candidatus Elarobacter sp.]|nr:discoidin domain-containing protein [Candidatus Elarobacter sp.]